MFVLLRDVGRLRPVNHCIWIWTLNKLFHAIFPLFSLEKFLPMSPSERRVANTCTVPCPTWTRDNIQGPDRLGRDLRMLGLLNSQGLWIKAINRFQKKWRNLKTLAKIMIFLIGSYQIHRDELTRKRTNKPTTGKSWRKRYCGRYAHKGDLLSKKITMSRKVNFQRKNIN